ncbi:response regulator [Leptolyngbya sp. FACHB-17]|uniref:response regulator transcription factor n=1 Tax=unclassified Leptolyngbya TaxID=2650499 RepID=UPI0016803063|nr:response regulator [Leptolyngbya sp. FACHB-17]MBD2080183.1 response regulator [Leptolyngbya sp. FACHB-17]
MKTRILLVEDQINLAQFIALELSAEGYQVSVEHNTKTGLIAAQVLCPDIIVLSWNLPGDAGSKMHYQLRAMGYQFPMVGMTVDDKSDRFSQAERNQIAWLVKPFTMNQLLDVIQQVYRTLHSAKSPKLRTV